MIIQDFFIDKTHKIDFFIYLWYNISALKGDYMYTVEDEKNNEYEDEYLENSFWDNNKGLIIKIIIIILCVIVLIWLFKALNNNRNTTGDESIHAASVLKVRLAAEDYFFLKNKKDDSKMVSLQTLKKEGLIDDVIDANNKVCGDTTSNVNLTKEVDAYKMTVKLACSTGEKEETFYYHNNTLACLNCNGQTKMTGKKNNEEINGGNKDDNNVVPVDNDEYYEYSCTNWSDWTKDRINDANLKERSKTLVQGVKYNNVSKTVYGDWSEYTTTPIVPRDDLEVEIKNTIEDVWSSVKVARDINTSNNVRVISTELVEDYNTCQDGFIENDVCYSNKTKVGNLTFKEYNSGKYKIQKAYCEGVKTLKNSEGKYVLTYVGCKYNEALEKKAVTYTIYKYQELEKQDITYYRSRLVTIVDDKNDPIYTKEKYEEKDLPKGYEKVSGSEETYYSYKYASCEK